jgi:hypothetical protein
LSPCFNWATRHEGVLGEWRYGRTHSLTSALDGGECLASRPGCFTPRERAPGTHWIGGWVSPRAVLDAVVRRKIPNPRRESNPITPVVQPVAQRYAEWATVHLADLSVQWQYYDLLLLWFSEYPVSLFYYFYYLFPFRSARSIGLRKCLAIRGSCFSFLDPLDIW